MERRGGRSNEGERATKRVEKNEEVKNELIATYGDKDKVFTIGKYFHKRAMQDEIVKSSVEIQN